MAIFYPKLVNLRMERAFSRSTSRSGSVKIRIIAVLLEIPTPFYNSLNAYFLLWNKLIALGKDTDTVVLQVYLRLELCFATDS